MTRNGRPWNEATVSGTGSETRSALCLRQKQIEQRAPEVIRRPLVVEAEHVGARSDARRGVAKIREVAPEDRFDRLVVAPVHLDMQRCAPT
jgi:hypothetical protein